MKEAEAIGADVYDLILKDVPKEPTDVYIVPHFGGSGTPSFGPDSKGTITKVERLRAVGGGVKSKTWLQPKADMSGKEVVSPAVSECGCLGAAILAGLGVGNYNSLDEAVELLVSEVNLFQPDMDMHDKYAERFAIYSELYPTLRELTHRM